MAFLPQFDYEVFLSYGWGDNDDPATGDRAWIREFKKALERDVSDSLPHGIRVYLDIEHSQNGIVPENLEAALRSSAIFLLVLTENSCRTDSWCQFEIQKFIKHSLNPNAKDRKQVFSILIRDVDREKWPPDLNPYKFVMKEDGRSSQFDKKELLERNTPCGKVFQKVAYDIAQQLKEIQGAISKTDYLAQTSDKLKQKVTDTQRETRLGERRSLLVRETTFASEEEFTHSVRHLLRWSDRSVHHVDESFATSPDGWSASAQEIQLRLAKERFAVVQQKKINIWKDPASEKPSFELLAEAFQNSNICLDTAHQDFLRFLLGHAAKTEAPAPPKVPEALTPFVYLDCVKEDKEAIQKLAPYFAEGGILVCWPFFEGPPKQRDDFNRQYAKRCRGVAVLYGKRSRIKTFSICNDVTAALGERADVVPKVVLLHPTDDPDRRFFLHPDFKSLPWDDRAQPPNGLHEFIARVSGGQP